MNGLKFKIKVGDFIKVKIKIFKKKLLLISLFLKKTISSTNVDKMIKEEKIIKKISKDNENSFMI